MSLIFCYIKVLFVPEESSSDASDPILTTAPVAPGITPSALTKTKDGDAFVLLTDRRRSSDTSFPLSPTRPHQEQQDVGSMVWSMARQTAPKPGRAQRLSEELNIESDPSPKAVQQRPHNETEPAPTSPKSTSADEQQNLDDECLQRFIKVHVRLMNDDQVSAYQRFAADRNGVAIFRMSEKSRPICSQLPNYVKRKHASVREPEHSCRF